MEKHDKCADLSQTQYVNKTAETPEMCNNLCLDYVAKTDQCWSTDYDKENRMCQINEKPGAYINTCRVSIESYHKNCFKGMNSVLIFIASFRCLKIAISSFNAKCLEELEALFLGEDWDFQVYSYICSNVFRTNRRP